MATSRERQDNDRSKHSERDASRSRTSGAGGSPLGSHVALDRLGNRALLSLLRSGNLQRKARISPPDDPLERDADRAADAAISGQHPARPIHAPRNAPGIQRMATEDQKLATALGFGPLSGQSASSPETTGPLYGGQKLDENTRDAMESRFGESFGDVRVHTGHRAAEAAGSLHSRAFTVGDDIVFGEGEFAPHTTEGRRLLAHELAHVVQQRQATGPIASEWDTERNADTAAHEAEGGGAPRVNKRAALGTIQRKPKVEAEQGIVVRTSISGTVTTPKTTWAVIAYAPESVVVATIFTVSDSDPVSASAYELPSEPGVLYLSLSATAPGSEIHPKKSAGRWQEIRAPGQVPPAPKPEPKPQPKPKPKPQPRPAPQPAPEPIGPAQENEEPTPAPLSPGPEISAIDRVTNALQTEPESAARMAPELSDSELESLSTQERESLLWSLALTATSDRLDVDTVARILDNTPDDKVTELQDKLFAHDGLLLKALAKNIRGNEDARKLIDALMRLWKRGELPTGEDDGKPRWMLGLMGNPIKVTRAQYDQMLKDAPITLERKLDQIRQEIQFDDQNRAWRNNPWGDVVDAWGGLQKPPTAAQLITSPEGFLRNPYGSADYAGRLISEGKFFEAGQQLQSARAMNQDLFRQWEAYRGHSIHSGESLETTLVVVRNGALVVLVVGAPEIVIPGMMIGGGLNAARQGIQISEGSRKEFSGEELKESIIMGGLTAPIVVYVPGAAYVASGIGIGSGIHQYSQGQTGGATLAFDLATSLAPVGQKAMSGRGGPSFGQWVRPRVAGAFMQMSVGLENVPALGGRNYTASLPWEPQSALVVDAAGRPAGLGSGAANAPRPSFDLPSVGPQSAARPNVWQTVTPSGSTPYQPYQLPFVVRLTDPVDAAFAENAPYQVGSVSQAGRVRTTASGRQLLSLDTIPLTAPQRQAARAVHGQLMGQAQQTAWQNATNQREQNEIAQINQLWSQGAPQAQQQARVLAREAFDRHRARYWAAVRANPALRAAFEDAGMRFTGGNTSAPIYDLPDGTVVRMTLEHSTRLADDPTQALSQTNLQFVLNDENSVMLEFLRANDPFQR